MKRFAIPLVLSLLGAFAQDAPKKKPGILERLNKRIEEANRKPGGPPPTTPATQVPTSQLPARTGGNQRLPHTVAYTPRSGSCAPFTWAPAPARIREGGDTSWEISGREPDPVQPEGDFTFESFGKTRSLRIQFPSVRAGSYGGFRDPVTRKNVTRIDLNDGATEPYEVEMAFVGDVLWHASCDKGVYTDHGPALRYDNNWIYFNRPEKFVRPGKDGSGKELELSPFVCPDCYFVDQVFRSGLDTDKFVVLVSPSRRYGVRHYFMRVKPEPSLIGGAPANDVCQLRDGKNGSQHCLPDPLGTLVHLRRETGPNQIFTEKQASYWIIQCKGSPCQGNLGFDLIVPENVPQSIGIPALQ